MSPPTRTAALAALADDTRWTLLVRLAERPASASALSRELPISRQAVAQHLEVLREAGLVDSARVGREVRFRALGSRLSAVACDLDAVARGWERRLEVVREAAETRVTGPPTADD